MYNFQSISHSVLCYQSTHSTVKNRWDMSEKEGQCAVAGLGCEHSLAFFIIWCIHVCVRDKIKAI